MFTTRENSMTAIAARVPAARVPAGFLASNALAAKAHRPAAEEATCGIRRTFSRGEELFAEGDTADFFYKIVSGTVRSGRLLSDGRRQIDAFHLAGDIFGLESGEVHR